jgi:UrcA family protein
MPFFKQPVFIFDYLQEKRLFNRHTRSVLLSATLLLTAVPLAANSAETRTITVKVNDLDLDGDAGRAVLRARIDRAVETICGDVHMRTTWALRAHAISCSNVARASAISQFDTLVATARSNKKVALALPVQ